jgi:hypothetical protein
MKRKTYLLLAILPFLLLGLTQFSVPVKAEEPYVKLYVDQPDGYIIPPAGPFPVIMYQIDIYIMTEGIVDGSATDSIVGWALDIQVDPSVIDIGWGYVWGAASGYSLWQWSRANRLPYPTLMQGGIDAPSGYWKDISEQIMPTPSVPPGGAGDAHFLAWPKLATIEFDLLSADYCKIELLRAEYMSPDGVWHPVTEVQNGHYGLPENSYLFDAMTDPFVYDWYKNPITSDWHELEPIYCQEWTLESWTDNGDGRLSESDQIDMVLIGGSGDKEWFHVEWVRPDPYDVWPNDGVVDLIVTWKEPVPEFPLGSVAPIALIAAVAYIWWVTRRKRQEAM